MNDRVTRWVRPEIQALSAYHVAKADGMIKLDAMENPFPLPEPIRQDLAKALANAAINRYPDPDAPALQQQIREVFQIPAEAGLILGNGSDELITLISQALAQPDAVMLAVEPSFVMYRMNALMSRMRYVGVPLNPDFQLDLPTTLAAIQNHQPALVFLAYPNNPSGAAFDKKAILEIIQQTAGLVVIDEAYEPFADDSFMSEVLDFPNVLVLRTLSKLGLAGIRLGYAVAAPAWIDAINKVRPPYNVNVLTQITASTALGHYEVFQAQTQWLKQARETLAQFLQKYRFIQRVFPSQANFLTIRVDDAPAVFLHLKQRNILIKNLHGTHPLLENCLRITIGSESENQALQHALDDFLGETA